MDANYITIYFLSQCRAQQTGSCGLEELGFFHAYSGTGVYTRNLNSLHDDCVIPTMRRRSLPVAGLAWGACSRLGIVTRFSLRIDTANSLLVDCCPILFLEQPPTTRLHVFSDPVLTR
jgi:hypothetical protein